MSDKYLKSRQHYIDQYDRHTVEHCRNLERIHQEGTIPPIEGKKVDEKEEIRLKKVFAELHNWFEAGERYKNKDKTIDEWMKRDEQRDRLLETAQAPEDITCFTCSRLMFVSSKHLEIGWDKKPDRVMFFYDCPLNHVPRRAFYNDGDEYKSKPNLCAKCKSHMERKSERVENKKIVTIETCSGCGHTVTDELDLSVTGKEEKPDPDYVKDRNRFCSDEEGRKYVQWMESAKELGGFMDKIKEKEKQKDLYDKVARIKKLKIIELEQLLSPILEKQQFVKFHFKDPEITKDVTVTFIAYDSKPGRTDRESTYDIKRIIKKALADTNWRLMSDGVSYRLGMIEGRLRAYEREEDLVKLVGGNSKKNQTAIYKAGDEVTL